ncbi:MAG: efflux RND transporter periplasmic adaptor subunit [Bdellovibrionales bacterium]|nr:efflux RND transporter periplasmic adaptor subunit [Ramlibacter sp.]
MDPQASKPPKLQDDDFVNGPGARVQLPERRSMGRRGVIIGTLIALLLSVGLGWLAWDLTHREPVVAGPGGAGGPGGPGGGGGRGALTVGVATAEKSDIPIVLEALGTVTPQATVRVRAQVSGTLQQLMFKEGQMVKKGDLLAMIDARQFEMALQQALGQRQRDEASAEAAVVTLQRYQTLLQQDSIARQEVDTQAALAKQLLAAVTISKANEGVARLNLGYTRITAPVSGRVGLRTVDVGNIVSTGDANGVAIITQLSPIDVQFAVPQDMASSLQQSGGASMKVDALDRTRLQVIESGEFASLDNTIDTTTGTVKAKARFANSKLALFPSQFVNVRLQLRTIEGAVVVPVAAVRTGANGDYVFVLKPDRTVTIRLVKRGQATVDNVQVIAGLQVGERVITEGADRLKEGSRVTLPGDAPGAGGRQGGRRRDGASSAAGAASGAAPGGMAMPASGSAAPQLQQPGLPPPQAAPGDAPADAQGRPGGRRQRASGAAASAGADTPPAEAGAKPAAAAPKPTAEQRQRMLDALKDDPEQLARRKKFLAALDANEPEALERWQRMAERRAAGGGGGGGGGGEGGGRRGGQGPAQ